MAQGFIFPTSVYGTISEVYGTAVPAYANTGGFPYGSGLQLGMFGLLFDGTLCRLLRSVGGVNPFDAVVCQTSNSNDYSVQQANAANQYLVAVNDRAGATPLVANNIAWMTEAGLGTVNCLGGIAAGNNVGATSTAGFVGLLTDGLANLQTGAVTGGSLNSNILLLNSTTLQGAYPVRFQ